MNSFSFVFVFGKKSYLSSLRADGPSFKLIMSRGFHTGLPTCMRKKERRRKKLTNRIKSSCFLLAYQMWRNLFKI